MSDSMQVVNFEQGPNDFCCGSLLSLTRFGFGMRLPVNMSPFST